MANNRTASVKVYRPTHVPKELHSVWHGAAQHLAGQGRLLTASGKVDYTAVNREYARAIAAYGRVASEKGKRAAAKQSKKPRVANVRVYKPSHVPTALHPVWHGAAVHLAKQGRLLTASGKVNYPAVNQVYQKALAAYHKVAVETK
jgi:hypothetical protein